MHDIARKNASSPAIVGEERGGTLERYGLVPLVALERLSSMKSRKMQRYATTDLAHEAQRVGEWRNSEVEEARDASAGRWT